VEELTDTNAERYMDGTLYKEIEHLLMSRLHEQNTIVEVTSLVDCFHRMMNDMYCRGQAREEKGQ